MFHLPNHVQRLIYEYDSTYYDIYKKVLKQLMTQYHTWHDWYRYIERRESLHKLENLNNNL